MANIFCTKKLEKIIGKQNINSNEVRSLIGDWNANVFYVNRKKFIFLINDLTCYSVIIPNFVKKDFPKFKEIFYQRFFDQLRYDKIIIDLKLINKLIEYPINFMRTNNNRKVIGTMTQFIKDMDYFLCYHDQMQTLQELNHRMTNNLVTIFGTKKYDMDRPIDLMQELLNKTVKRYKHNKL
jgi:hypothetical protein